MTVSLDMSIHPPLTTSCFKGSGPLTSRPNAANGKLRTCGELTFNALRWSRMLPRSLFAPTAGSWKALRMTSGTASSNALRTDWKFTSTLNFFCAMKTCSRHKISNAISCAAEGKHTSSVSSWFCVKDTKI